MASTKKKTQSTDMPVYQKYDMSEAFASAEQQYREAAEAAYKGQAAAIQMQQSQLAGEYDDLRAQVYQNARLHALGNNESLAAKGLAGAAYAGPISGVSETSRIAQDTAMQNSINDANKQEQAARDELAMQLLQAGYTRDQEVAKYLAELAIERVNAEQSENQFAANYDFDAWEAALKQTQWEMEYELEQQTEAYQNALAELDAFGKVMTQKAADALGVKIGTTSLQYQQLSGKFKTTKSGSSGSSKSKSSSKKTSTSNLSSGSTQGYQAVEKKLIALNSNPDHLNPEASREALKEGLMKGQINMTQYLELKSKWKL